MPVNLIFEIHDYDIKKGARLIDDNGRERKVKDVAYVRKIFPGNYSRVYKIDGLWYAFEEISTWYLMD